MTVIEHIDARIARSLTNEVHAALKEFAEQRGMSVTLGNTTYSDTNIAIKAELAIVRDGVVLTREAANFRFNALFHNVNPDLLNTWITFNGKRYCVTGWVPTRRKYPISVVGENGRHYKLPLSAVKDA